MATRASVDSITSEPPEGNGRTANDPVNLLLQLVVVEQRPARVEFHRGTAPRHGDGEESTFSVVFSSSTMILAKPEENTS
jgi:hypothetical protein